MQIDNSSLEGPRISPAARFAWILLILATLYLCYFYNLGAIGFVGPDEPRYAWIARDMAESGDWVTPRLYGQPWFEKPVLYYWGAALNFKIFGVSEAAARFPSALAALLATLAMAWLAWRLYGGETARWLLLLLPTTVGMIGFSHAAATDMPFSAMLTIAMVYAARLIGVVPPAGYSLHSPSTSFYTISRAKSLLGLVLFGFFLGLAVLAKGPAAIVLSGGAVLLWAVFTKRWRDAFRCLHPVAIVTFCLTALPWYILCSRRNPDFFRIFIIEHNFKRYLTPEFQHIQPFWFYVSVVLVAFVPWTLILLWSAVRGSLQIWRNRQISSSILFFLSWAVFCLLFFTTSKSKLPGYILPAIPPIGLLLARSLVALVPRDKKYFRWLLSGWAILSLPVALLLIWMGWHARPSPTYAAMIVVGCVLLALAMANLLLTLRESFLMPGLEAATMCVLPIFLLLLFFHRLASPWLPWDPSGRTLSSELLALKIPSNQIYVAGMHRGQQFSLSFYLHQEVETWSGDSAKEGYLLLKSKDCSENVKSPLTCGSEPVALRASGWFLYSVRQSDPSVGGLGALGGGNDSGRNGDGEPR